jgi:hypothetical protein
MGTFSAAVTIRKDFTEGEQKPEDTEDSGIFKAKIREEHPKLKIMTDQGTVWEWGEGKRMTGVGHNGKTHCECGTGNSPKAVEKEGGEGMK